MSILDKGRFMKALQTGLLALLSTFVSNVYAIDLDLYTYNGFNETVMALQRIALVFNDGDFATLFFVAAVLGIVCGGSAFFGRQLVGNYQANTQFSMAWLYSVVMGVVIYQATIIPKGNIVVYDPVRNNFQTVGNIPDLIVLVAGVLNKIERLTVDISDSTSAFPYGNEAGGVSFSLLYAATTDNNSIDDFYLFKSIKEYYKQCSPIAMTSPAFTFNLNDLRTNTNSIFEQLQLLRSPSTFTTVFSVTNKAGSVVSCETAWNDSLSPALLATGTYTQLLNTVCGKAGFDITNIAELTRCQGRIAALNQTVYDYAAGDAYHLLRASALANAIAQSMQDENPDVGVRALTNRAMMTEGIGASMAADEWIPTARAVLFAVVLGITPLLFCFVVTPLVWKALTVYMGLLVWLALWGVADVITHAIAMDHAQAALLEIKRNHMGVTAMLLSPEAALKAMAIIGKIRSQGVMIASVLSAGLFGFSAYSLSGIASSWSQTMDREGSEAANRTITPEGRNATISGQQSAVAGLAANQMQGMDRMVQSQMMSQGKDVESNMALANSTGAAGMDLRETMQAGGQMSGGQMAGALLGGMQYASAHPTPGGSRNVQDVSARLSQFNQVMSMGGTAGQQRAVSELGLDPDRASDMRAYWETLQGVNSTTSMMGVKERLEQNLGREMSDGDFTRLAADYHTASLSADMNATRGMRDSFERMLTTNRSMDVGTATGLLSVAHMNDLSPENLGRAVGAMRGSDAVAQREILNDYDPGQIILANYVNSASNIESGNALNDVANQYGGGINGLLRNMSAVNASQQLANFVTFDNVSRALGDDYVSTAIAKNSVGISVAVSPERIDQYEGKIFGSQTADFFRSNGGGAVSFTLDPVSGDTVLTAQGNSGESMRVDDSVFINKAMTVEAGTQVRTDSAAAIFLDGNRTEALQVLEKAGTQTQARESLAKSFADWLGMYAQESNTDQRSQSTSGSVSANAGLNIPLSAAGVGAGGSVSHQVSQTTVDSQHSNPILATTRALINETETAAEQAAEQSVAIEEQKRLERDGSHLSAQERDRLFEEAKNILWYEGIRSGLHLQQEMYQRVNTKGAEESGAKEMYDGARGIHE